MNLFDLSGRTAVVTGAGRGLGKAVALGLAEAGADVVLVTNSTPADDLKQEIAALGRKALTIQPMSAIRASFPALSGRRWSNSDVLIFWLTMRGLSGVRLRQIMPLRIGRKCWTSI